MFETGVRGADAIAPGASITVVNLTILYVRWVLYIILVHRQGKIKNQREKSKMTVQNGQQRGAKASLWLCRAPTECERVGSLREAMRPRLAGRGKLGIDWG